MKELINEKVKHRQWYRPFAPSMLREEVSEWFERDDDSPYMNIVLRFKKVFTVYHYEKNLLPDPPFSKCIALRANISFK